MHGRGRAAAEIVEGFDQRLAQAALREENRQKASENQQQEIGAVLCHAAFKLPRFGIAEGRRRCAGTVFCRFWRQSRGLGRRTEQIKRPLIR